MDTSIVKKSFVEDAVNCVSKVDQYEANVRPLFASNKDKLKNTFSIDYILGLSNTNENDQSCSSSYLQRKSNTNETSVSETSMLDEIDSSKITKCDMHNTLAPNFLYPGWIPHQLESIRNSYSVGFTNDLCKYYMHIVQ